MAVKLCAAVDADNDSNALAAAAAAAAVAVLAAALEVVGIDSILKFPMVEYYVEEEEEVVVVVDVGCNFANVLDRSVDSVVDDLEEEEEEEEQTDVVWQNMHVGPVGEEDAVDEIEVAAAVVDDQKRQRDAVHEDYVDNVRLEWLVLVFVVVGAGVESAEPGSEDTVVVVVVVEDED